MFSTVCRHSKNSRIEFKFGDVTINCQNCTESNKKKHNRLCHSFMQIKSVFCSVIANCPSFVEFISLYSIRYHYYCALNFNDPSEDVKYTVCCV